jgi:hypothetical protein
MFRKLTCLLTLLLIAASCAPPEDDGAGPGKTPVSVRGWIAYIQLPAQDVMKVSDPATARQRMHQFLSDTNLYVPDMPFVSGAISEAGTFIMLDVPPGDVTLRFQPPGLPEGQLVLRNLPGNADVLLAGLRLDGDKVSLVDPAKSVVRIPIDEDVRRKLDQVVHVGDQAIEVWEVPYNDLVDRRDFPTGEETLPADMVVPTVK